MAFLPWYVIVGQCLTPFTHCTQIHIRRKAVGQMGHAKLFVHSGAVVSSLGPTVAPVLRSMTSKVVSIEERGNLCFIFLFFYL